MTTIVLIQARMRSARLPGKVLLDICGQPMLGRVVQRAQAADVGEVVVATGRDPANLPIAEWCVDYGVRCLMPDVAESDVVGRFARAAAYCGAGGVVRLTGDCPLVDPAAIRLVAAVLSGAAEYVTTAHPDSSWPEGVGDVEALTVGVLCHLDEFACGADREHVTRRIRRNPGMYHCAVIARDGHPRWPRSFPTDSHWAGPGQPSYSVDDEASLARVRRIYAAVGKDVFGVDDIEDADDVLWYFAVCRQLEANPTMTVDQAADAVRSGGCDTI